MNFRWNEIPVMRAGMLYIVPAVNSGAREIQWIIMTTMKSLYWLFNVKDISKHIYLNQNDYFSVTSWWDLIFAWCFKYKVMIYNCHDLIWVMTLTLDNTFFFAKNIYMSVISRWTLIPWFLPLKSHLSATYFIRLTNCGP